MASYFDRIHEKILELPEAFQRRLECDGLDYDDPLDYFASHSQDLKHVSLRERRAASYQRPEVFDYGSMRVRAAREAGGWSNDG